MHKLEKRAIIVLMAAAALFIGLAVFTWRFIVHGSEWASFYGNQQIFTNGVINRGSVYDRNGIKLLNCDSNGFHYSDDEEIRKSTLHAVGDPKGNVATGAINKWGAELIGYDLLNGTYDTGSEGKKISLTIDAKASKAAYEALDGRNGTVGVFNYKTGEIMCMVNTPTVDPIGDTKGAADHGAYFNTFLMGKLTPGSTFKLITSAAAIENDSNYVDSFSYRCSGSEKIGPDTITCVRAHGSIDFKKALADSCNCAFGEITSHVGASDMKSTTKSVGLMGSVDINGIDIAKGSFDFPDDNDVKLRWAGIGQAEDLVNPCAMMIYMGAIANDGKAVNPSLIKSSTFLKKITGGSSLGHYIEEDTSVRLREMMKNNVRETYGEGNFSGLDIYAKSGTAEVGAQHDDAWFTGFIDDDEHPYAFVVWIKGGGTGYEAAGPVAKKTLDALVENN